MLVEDLNNSYIAGKDNYPELLEATLKLLSNYKIEGQFKRRDSNEDGFGTSFAQKHHKDLSKVSVSSVASKGIWHMIVQGTVHL
jgi:hypothetical protein